MRSLSFTSLLGTSLLGLAALAACSGPSKTGGTTTGGGETAPQAKPDRAAGLAAFETVRAVFQHPRCQNCHPAGDAPLQGDDGRPHNQNVIRGPKGEGVTGAECTSCHGAANPPEAYGRNMPPGTSKPWHMPPPDMQMVFVGASPRALCEQVKDPARNGGRDLPALRAHLDDPLVVWAWSPGAGRAPVPTPRATFLAAWETWAAADAPCPDQ